MRRIKQAPPKKKAERIVWHAAIRAGNARDLLADQLIRQALINNPDLCFRDLACDAIIADSERYPDVYTSKQAETTTNTEIKILRKLDELMRLLQSGGASLKFDEQPQAEGLPDQNVYKRRLGKLYGAVMSMQDDED